MANFWKQPYALFCFYCFYFEALYIDWQMPSQPLLIKRYLTWVNTFEHTVEKDTFYSMDIVTRFSTPKFSFCLKHSIRAPYEQANTVSWNFHFCEDIWLQVRKSRVRVTNLSAGSSILGEDCRAQAAEVSPHVGEQIGRGLWGPLWELQRCLHTWASK